MHLQRVSLVPRATAGQTIVRFPDSLSYTATHPPGIARDAEKRKKDEMFEGENIRAALQQLKKKKKKRTHLRNATRRRKKNNSKLKMRSLKAGTKIQATTLLAQHKIYPKKFPKKANEAG